MFMPMEYYEWLSSLPKPVLLIIILVIIGLFILIGVIGNKDK